MKAIKRRVLPPLHPNAGVTAWYRRQLLDLIDAMHTSIMYWLQASYRANEPLIATDELPATALKRQLTRLSAQWRRNFRESAKKLSKGFGRKSQGHTDSAFRAAMKGAGFTVQFKMSPAMRDIMNATINEQVNLIKSIPEQYLKDVAGSVMRAVQSGRDLGTLAKELQDAYGVTKRRAALIALDQANKANASMVKARQIELELFTAVWLHSHGGKKPRPKHVAFDGKTYDVRKGAKIGDKGQYVWPGEEIHCRCVSRTVVPGFN